MQNQPAQRPPSAAAIMQEATEIHVDTQTILGLLAGDEESGPDPLAEIVEALQQIMVRLDRIEDRLGVAPLRSEQRRD